MSRSRFNFCSSSFLYNQLQSYKDKVLVLDTRNQEDYVTHAISGSINLGINQMEEYMQIKKEIDNITQITLNDLPELMTMIEKEKFSQRKRSYTILVVSETSFPQELISQVKTLSNSDELADSYDIPQKYITDEVEKLVLNSPEKDAVSLGFRLHQLLQEDKVRELYILVDGANNFFERYPYMDPSYHPNASAFLRTNSLITAKLDITYNFPNDIYDNRLFLGSYNQASQYVLIQGLGITHVVNVTAECTNVHEAKGIKYLHIVILDEKQVDVMKFFKDAYEFIDAALSVDNKNKVLLHCALGKSRSATITIMFLMKKFNWSAEKALEYVKSRRRIVDPNYGFLEQLDKFEKIHCNFENKESGSEKVEKENEEKEK